MNLIIAFLWAALVKNIYCEYLTITNCCPDGWNLIKINRGFFQNDKYKCLEVINILDKGVEFVGNLKIISIYRENKINNTIHMPECEKQKLIFFNGEEELELTPNSCIGSLNGMLVSISCPLRNDQVFEYVNVVHKCCPVDYIYDSYYKKCVLSNTFWNFTNNFIFMNSQIDCPYDKTLVEYHLNDNRILFKRNQIILNNLKQFSMKNYCIERIKSESDNINGTSITRNNWTNSNLLVRTCDNGDICNKIPCIRRCCRDGEIFSKGNSTSYCKKDDPDQILFHSFESLDISGNFSKPSVFGILRSLDCLKYRLDPDLYDDEAHTIDNTDGSLLVLATKKKYTNNEYCVEKIRNYSSIEQKLYTFLCFDTKVVVNDKIRFKMYPVGLLISCLFYAMTLLVYLSISKLRNLPGQILICLVVSLFSAYLGIALGQLMPTSNDDVCFVSGFFIYFCLIAAFSWMNVMCFDIWKTFGSTRKKNALKHNNHKRFGIYSLYGWGLPTALTICTVALTKSDALPEAIRPHFGHGRCWFTYDSLASANLVFFSGPVGILFLINFIFFSLTLRYCNRVKREIFRMQSSNSDKPVLKRRFFVDKARFVMNTKLFVVMGITWLLELLSIIFYDHNKTFFWVISDSFNVLLGVFVFFIFVFKKKVWQSIKYKLGLGYNERSRNSFKTTCATHSTFSTNTSMTRLNTIVNDAVLLQTYPYRYNRALSS